MSNFLNELQSVINRYSKENGSHTPDYILSEYLNDCLSAYNKAVQSRDKQTGNVNKAKISTDPILGIPGLNSDK